MNDRDVAKRTKWFDDISAVQSNLMNEGRALRGLARRLRMAEMPQAAACADRIADTMFEDAQKLSDATGAKIVQDIHDAERSSHNVVMAALAVAAPEAFVKRREEGSP